jgi:hypothetical protein
MYSELNFLWEAWLGVYTNNQPEAIVNQTQRKRLSDYQRLTTYPQSNSGLAVASPKAARPDMKSR